MKQNSKSEAVDARKKAAEKVSLSAASVWNTPLAPSHRPASPAPAVWTRYIDSRLKQFSAR